ncbi:MAG: hypothetical protein HZB26_00660 [Candidatus Hydrogenedentes bacterium]|nr:hypothetical protein [Candidatus Hydrogenedentota bacterium]
MNTLKTFRFWLEPDQDIPRFRRLQWELIEVPVAEVLLQGIHPWAGADKHPSLLEEFVKHMNSGAAKVASLEPMQYSHDITSSRDYCWSGACLFQATLKNIQQNLCFVDSLSYLELLEIAKDRLRTAWGNGLALTLAKSAYPGFQELRQFLKSKDKNMKLSSYDDLERYNLGTVLSLDDFAERDTLLISEGIPTKNFRSMSALSEIADEHGRLCLVPEIRDLSVAVITKSDQPHVCGTHVMWHVTRSGNVLMFRPDTGESIVKREAAAEFAKRWRTNQGHLVFQTTLDRLSEMTEKGEGAPSFPTLRYGAKSNAPTATLSLQPSKVPAFYIGKYPSRRCSGDQLREILRTHGVPMTGNKEAMVLKLAKLAADKYEQRRTELDRFFTRHRYVRIGQEPANAEYFAVLEDMGHLRNLLLTMYAMKHLRGGAVLEPAHENATYTVEELARALVTGKVGLSGGFLRVA